MIVKNIAFFLVAFLAGGLATSFVWKRLEKPVPDCNCNCPEPTVQIQPFEPDKIKGIREFNYSPNFNGSISIAGVDSTRLRSMIQSSVDQSLKKLVRPKFLK